MGAQVLGEKGQGWRSRLRGHQEIGGKPGKGVFGCVEGRPNLTVAYMGNFSQ